MPRQKKYAKITKRGWTCVAGELGILCHRNKAPLESVSLDFNQIKIVDAISCKTKVTPVGRRHTVCEFKKR